MKRLIGILFVATSFFAAAQPSDLLRIVVRQNDGDRHSVVSLERGKGPVIGGPDIFNLLANAPFVSFEQSDAFDPLESPNPPQLFRIVLGPVKLKPGQPFFGVVGDFVLVSPDEFLRRGWSDYSATVNGVGINATGLQIRQNTSIGTTFFNLSQSIDVPGTYELVYHWRRTIALPATQDPLGVFELHVVIVIEA